MSAQWTPGSGDEMFAALPGEVLQISSQELMLLDPGTGERHPMTPEVLEALESCRVFAPLTEHRKTILERLPQLAEKSVAVDAILLALMQRGLLVPAAQLLQSYAQSSRPSMPLAPLCLRLSATRRALIDERDLHSLRELSKLSGGLRMLLDPAMSEDQLSQWQRALEEAQIAAEWWDAAAQEEFLIPLAINENDQAALLALAGPHGAGSVDARLSNFALLLSAGHRVVLLDADQLGPPRASPEVRQGLDLSASAARSAWFETQQAGVLPEGALAAALDWCGRSLGQLLRVGAPLALPASQLAGRSLAELRRLPADAYVDSLIFGTHGALDIDHNRWLYTLDARSRERFWSPEAAYLERRRGRHLLHGLSQSRLLAGTPMAPSVLAAGTTAGYFNPLAEQPHAHFGAVGQLLDPQRRSLHLPWSLSRSDATEIDRVDQGRQPFRPSLNRLLADWALADLPRCQAQHATDRAQWWSAQLSDLANASAAHRASRLLEFVARSQAQLVAGLQHQLETAQAPSSLWQEDVVAIVESNARAMLDSASPGLAGYVEGEVAERRFASELHQLADWTPRWLQWLQRAAERNS